MQKLLTAGRYERIRYIHERCNWKYGESPEAESKEKHGVWDPYHRS